jgi:transcriptional regulator with XRE-family HTH domain
MPEAGGKVIGERIQRRRKDLKLSQSELARRSSLTPAAIWQYERGERTPSSDALANLAKALKVSADYLLGVRDANWGDLTLDNELQTMFRGLPKLSEADKQKLFDYFLLLKKQPRHR